MFNFEILFVTAKSQSSKKKIPKPLKIDFVSLFSRHLISLKPNEFFGLLGYYLWIKSLYCRGFSCEGYDESNSPAIPLNVVNMIFTISVDILSSGLLSIIIILCRGFQTNNKVVLFHILLVSVKIYDFWG